MNDLYDKVCFMLCFKVYTNKTCNLICNLLDHEFHVGQDVYNRFRFLYSLCND
jgi:hypothetical protein